jgi:hypothetical protein
MWRVERDGFDLQVAGHELRSHLPGRFAFPLAVNRGFFKP